jgi:outer membrane protein assembly factor BamE (lipoprotein component of BamABCDE complex)
MYKLLSIVFLFILTACSEKAKDFASVKVGMSSQEVLQYAGEPDKRQDIGVADLWVYESADRTVVFRKDTVYNIITSANVRIDSVKTTLDKIGDKIEVQAEKAGATIKTQAEKAGEKIDSLGRKIKKNTKDTAETY